MLAYDDACHLKRFIDRRQTSKVGKFLASIKIAVDRMHFKNHVDKWCRKNLDPDKIVEFKKLNTEACEQTFIFVARYRYATKHMGQGMYHLFHYTIADMFNHDKLARSHKKN